MNLFIDQGQDINQPVRSRLVLAVRYATNDPMQCLAVIVIRGFDTSGASIMCKRRLDTGFVVGSKIMQKVPS